MSALLRPLPPALLPVAAVAQRFGVSGRTIRRWAAEGKLRAFREGHVVRIYADSVVEALQRGSLVKPRKIGRGA